MSSIITNSTGDAHECIIMLNMSPACLAFTIWLCILFLLPETLRARVGNGELHTDDANGSKWAHFLVLPPYPFSELAPDGKRGPPPPKPSLKMYWNLLSTVPIFIVTMNTALLYSTYFCISVVLPTALGDVYAWDTTATGLGFLAVGIAMVVGSLSGGRFSDWRRKKLVERLALEAEDQEREVSSSGPSGRRKQPAPETRLDDQIWGVLVCASGCVMFGWLVHFSVHPAAVLVATFLNGFGMSTVFITTTAFLTEAVPKQAALSFALGNMLRNPGAAVAAVLAPTLIERMGWGWCFFGLGVLDVIAVGGSVMWLRFNEARLRHRRNNVEEK